jgi:hypothetical protein
MGFEGASTGALFLFLYLSVAFRFLADFLFRVTFEEEYGPVWCEVRRHYGCL